MIISREHNFTTGVVDAKTVQMTDESSECANKVIVGRLQLRTKT